MASALVFSKAPGGSMLRTLTVTSDDTWARDYGPLTVIDRDERIKEFAEVTKTVHRYGAKIAAQLSPGTGRLADAFLPDGS